MLTSPPLKPSWLKDFRFYQGLPKPDSLKNYLFGDAKLIKNRQAQAKKPTFLRPPTLRPTAIIQPSSPARSPPPGHPTHHPGSSSHLSPIASRHHPPGRHRPAPHTIPPVPSSIPNPIDQLRSPGPSPCDPPPPSPTPTPQPHRTHTPKPDLAPTVPPALPQPNSRADSPALFDASADINLQTSIL